MMTKQFILGFLLIGLLIPVIGCDPKGRGLKVEFVEGVVTLDGEPVEGATITFIPVNEGEGAESAIGRSKEGGKYKLSSMNGDPEKGAIAGEYRIIVTKTDVHTPSTEGMTYEQASNVTAIHTEVLHAIYRDRTKTPLTATVNKGKNKIDIELKSKP